MRTTMDVTESLRTFEAEKIFLYAVRAIADYPGLANNADIKAIIGQASTELVLQMRSWCLAGRIPSRTETKTIRWPNGVWQMFKHKFIPQWFVEWFPVVWDSVEVPIETHHYFVCPHLVMEERSQHVRFMATGTDMASFIGGSR
jgi:hypothetical protein